MEATSRKKWNKTKKKSLLIIGGPPSDPKYSSITDTYSYFDQNEQLHIGLSSHFVDNDVEVATFAIRRVHA